MRQDGWPDERDAELRSIPTGMSRASRGLHPLRPSFPVHQPTGLSLDAVSQATLPAGVATSPPFVSEKAFTNPEDKFWAMYLEEADKFDKGRMRNWKGDTDGILIFTGLFAATVATFAVQSSQLLSPTSTEAAILSHISQQLSASLNQALNNSPALVDLTVLSDSADVPAYAIRVNILWFLSLVLSLGCALAATLMQQWARRYLRAASHRSAPQRRGPIHVYVSMGIDRFGLNQAVSAILSLLHIAVFLFFAGLLDFLFSLNRTVAYAAAGVIATMAVVYITLSSMPAIFLDSPYETPLSPLIVPWYRLYMKCAAARMDFLAVVSRSVFGQPSMLNRFSGLAHCLHRTCRLSSYSRKRRLMEHAQELSMPRIKYALQQILKNINEHREMEQFTDALRPLIRSPTVAEGIALVTHLFDEHQIAHKLVSLLASCASTYATLEPPPVRIRRMHTVITFQHDIARHFGFDIVLRLAHDQCLALADDTVPTIAFLARLMLAESKTALQIARMGPYPVLDIRCEYLTDDADIDDAAGGALVNFTRFVYVLLHFAAFDVEEGPLQVYRSLWEPVLRLLKEGALHELSRCHVFSRPNPAFANILEDIGLSGYIPTSPVPAQNMHRDFSWALSRCPRTIVDSLRQVAEAYPALPLTPFTTLPQSLSGTASRMSAARPPTSTTGTGGLDEQSRASRLGVEAFAHVTGPLTAVPAHKTAPPSTVLSSGGARVVLGPLQWGRRPAREFSALLRAWPHTRREFFPAQLNHCRTLTKREGYARIFYPNAVVAAHFIETWTSHAPSLSSEVLTRAACPTIWDGSGDDECRTYAESMV